MTDAELIQHHGGPTRLAEKLGWQEKRGAIQRINNWRTRGIPAAIKLAFPALFLPGWTGGTTASVEKVPSAEVSHG